MGRSRDPNAYPEAFFDILLLALDKRQRIAIKAPNAKVTRFQWYAYVRAWRTKAMQGRADEKQVAQQNYDALIRYEAQLGVDEIILVHRSTQRLEIVASEERVDDVGLSPAEIAIAADVLAQSQDAHKEKLIANAGYAPLGQNPVVIAAAQVLGMPKEQIIADVLADSKALEDYANNPRVMKFLRENP
jgi:hypothetical protein